MKERIQNVCTIKNTDRNCIKPELTRSVVTICEYREMIRPYVAHIRIPASALKEETILVEGQLGTMDDTITAST